MNIFHSHFYTLLIFSLIVSTIISLVRFEERRQVIRYGLKLFIFMVAGVIVASWVMHLI